MEVVIRYGVFGSDGAARAGLAVTALDPAGGDAQALGDADVVILALRHMQVVSLAIAPCAFEAATGVGEILRIGFLAKGVVAAQQQVKRFAERACKVLQGGSRDKANVHT